jgi:(1->4)-alpha-D-glucan 1-alpha-D-glucosylmutase
MIPRATMRLQFHKGFAFADAERHVPYFARLGISHIYASPVTTARAGSMHGYDVVDPTRVNPELGGEEGLRRLVTSLRAAGLGLIVDIVPNHMAVGAENPWWFDVLKHGQASRYAPYFDIDWNAENEALRGKVLLPFLGRPYREAIAANEIALAREGGAFVACYFQQRFPIADRDVPDIERLSIGAFHSHSDEGRRRLDAVLSRQHYRLAWWRIANDEINWRRFFDINELAGLRMEHSEAFEDVHALVFRLYADGLIDGVRIDHIDGLSDPAGYCPMLRRRLDELADRRPPEVPRGRAYLVVEKFLVRGETLPAAWDCDGTSGYDFMNDVSEVQHDARGDAPLGRLWHSVSGRSADFAAEEQAARREILARSFSAQLEACAASFDRLARAESRELSRASLRRALVELLTQFPVYRTYANSTERPERDGPFLAAAIAGAMSTCLSTDRTAVDCLHMWLRERCADSAIAALQDRAVAQFQQLSAPVAAKAVEDTAFYRYGKLLSRNDVGFDVRQFSASSADFHASVLRRRAEFPHAMLATATHDHKRGEDVRARLAVLSEGASAWADVVPRWIERCRPLRRESAGALLPHSSDIAILLQMIVGAWPLDLGLDDGKGRETLSRRLAQWQEKSLREAKLETDWTVPNESYESAARDLLTALVERNAAPDLLSDLVAFAKRIGPAGAVNGLAQTLLKVTVPGVPDIYQGTELWDFSLVDPDNRQPVDFDLRAAGIGAATFNDLVGNWRSGFVKQALIAHALNARRERPALFSEGSYEPMQVCGEFADRVIAFIRRLGDDVAVTIVPRAASGLLRNGAITFTPGAWKDTTIALPPHAAAPLFNVFDGADISGHSVPIESLFHRLPVALLMSGGR